MGPHPSLTGDTASRGTTCTRGIRVWRQKGSCRESHCPGEVQQAETGYIRDKCKRPEHLLHSKPVTKHHIQWQTPGQEYTWSVGGVTAVWFGGPFANTWCLTPSSPHPSLILQALSRPMPSPVWGSLRKQRAGAEADKEQLPALPIGCGHGRKCPAEAGQPWCICSRTQTCGLRHWPGAPFVPAPAPHIPLPVPHSLQQNISELAPLLQDFTPVHLAKPLLPMACPFCWVQNSKPEHRGSAGQVPGLRISLLQALLSPHASSCSGCL